jgi:acyl-CoA thioester hydrolase
MARHETDRRPARATLRAMSAASNASAPRASDAPAAPVATHEIEVRVRYPECDPMGFVHHAVYPIWLEMGRTEMLRAAGGDYRALEEAGVFLAVVRLDVRYRRPARYDDVVTVRTQLLAAGPVKIEHAYEVVRGGEVLVEARTTLACLDREGRARPVPANLSLGG